jgi:hypothetical protein
VGSRFAAVATTLGLGVTASGRRMMFIDNRRTYLMKANPKSTMREGQLARIRDAYGRLSNLIRMASELNDDERESLREWGNVNFALLQTSEKDLDLEMPPEVRDALIEVLNYIGPDEEDNWEKLGRPEDGSHIWPSICTVWRWLGFSDDMRRQAENDDGAPK